MLTVNFVHVFFILLPRLELWQWDQNRILDWIKIHIKKPASPKKTNRFFCLIK